MASARLMVVPSGSPLLGVLLDLAELVVVLCHDEPHGMEDGVAEPGLLAWSVLVVSPVIYVWEPCGESIVLVLGVGVSPEVYAGIVAVLLIALSVMMLLMIWLLSSDLSSWC